MRRHASLEGAVEHTRRLSSRPAMVTHVAAITPLWRRGRSNTIPILVANLPADSPHSPRATGDWGNVPLFKIGVSIMRVDHPQLNKRDRRAEPSFWVDEPTDDALSLLENALRGDEPTPCNDEPSEEAQTLLEENARLRELLVQLSDLIRKNGVRSR